jgi:hypothetical protein
MQGCRRSLAINESVACAVLDNEIVLLNVETGIYFGLDAVAARIWALLTEGADEERVCDRLLAEYEVDAHKLRTDVSDFIEILAAKGLIRTEFTG